MATTEIITCINCPVGCRIEVTHEGETVLSVKGNTCKRGDAYARQECVAPLRMVTAVIPVENSATPLSVKTASPVPKHLIPEVMTALKAVRSAAPVALGQTVLPDVCGTGIPVVATRPLE